MKVLVVGCGVIGTIYGWAMTAAGCNVTHFVRKNKMSQYSAGIELDIYDLRSDVNYSVTDKMTMSLLNSAGRGSTVQGLEATIIPDDVTRNYPKEQLTTYYPKLIDTLNEQSDFDLLIVPTKHTQLLAALKQLYPKLKNAKFLIFCAHWGTLADIDAVIPREQYILGYPASSGGYDDRKMVVNIRSDYRIGRVDGQDPELLKSIVALFGSAGFIPDFKQNMLEWLWVHHAINAGTIGSLIYAGGFNQEILDGPDFAKNFHAATLEAVEVLKARGVAVDDYPDIQAFTGQAPEQVLQFYRQLFIDTKIGQRSMQSGHHKHSAEEMQQYYLDILTTGRQLGVAMPILESYEEQINKNIAEINE